MKDFWGNDALDIGDLTDLMNKYKDKLIVTVIDRPLGQPYVLRLFEREEWDAADSFLDEYRNSMHARGIKAFGTSITRGTELHSEMINAFQGGVIF